MEKSEESIIAESILQENQNKYLIKLKGDQENKKWMKKNNIKNFEDLYKQYKNKNKKPIIITLNFDYQKYLKPKKKNIKPKSSKQYELIKETIKEVVSKTQLPEVKQIEKKIEETKIEKVNIPKIVQAKEIKELFDQFDNEKDEQPISSLNCLIGKQLNLYQKIKSNIQYDQFIQEDEEQKYPSIQKTMASQTQELDQTPDVSDVSSEKNTALDNYKPQQIKIINPFKPNQDVQEDVPIPNQKAQRYKNIEHIIEVIPFKFKLQRLRNFISYVPKGTHILLCVQDKAYEYIQKKNKEKQIKTNLIIEQMSNIEKYDPSGEFLICANDDQLKLRRNKMYFDTVYHVIHFDMPDNVDQYFQRLRVVKNAKQSIIFMSEYDISQINSFIKIFLEMNQKIPQMIYQIDEASRNEQQRTILIHKFYKELSDSNFDLDYSHLKQKKKNYLQRYMDEIIID